MCNLSKVAEVTGHATSHAQVSEYFTISTHLWPVNYYFEIFMSTNCRETCDIARYQQISSSKITSNPLRSLIPETSILTHSSFDPKMAIFTQFDPRVLPDLNSYPV